VRRFAVTPGLHADVDRPAEREGLERHRALFDHAAFPRYAAVRLADDRQWADLYVRLVADRKNVAALLDQS
jgi:hypothetical protein